MQLVRRGSAWFYALFLLFHLWGRLSASTSPPPLPTPTLEIQSRSRDCVVLVCRAPPGHRGLSFMLYHDRLQVDSREHHTGSTEARFTVGVTDWVSGQDYIFCCVYRNQQGQYSAFSTYLKLQRSQAGDGPCQRNPSSLTPHLSPGPPTDSLPAPTLVLQQQTDAWHLQCTGSPAYPGASFSLFLEDQQFPVATLRAKAVQHLATFPVPVQDATVASYQCQYGVQLGSRWSNSGRSPPLAITRGIFPAASSGVDWPLVLGSFSAAVLFLGALVLLVVMVKRKVRAAAEEKKRRQGAQLWTSEVHGKDHVVDLPLQCRSFNSQDWTSGDPENRPPPWNNLSSFTPLHPSY